MFTSLVALLNGCIHRQAHFSVVTGRRHAPAATTVFADADAFAKRRGFTLDNIETMNGLKTAYYHRNANYLSVGHRTDSFKVDFDLVANSDEYHRGIANRFQRDFTSRYAAEYGRDIVSQK